MSFSFSESLRVHSSAQCERNERFASARVSVCVCLSVYLNVSVPVLVCVHVCHRVPVWELSKTKNPLSHCVRLPLQAIAPIFGAPSLSLQAHTADRIWLTFNHYAPPLSQPVPRSSALIDCVKERVKVHGRRC